MSYRVPREVAHVVLDDDVGDTPPVVFLMKLPDGEPVVLAGSAAVIWSYAAQGAVDVCSAVAKIVSQPVEEVRPATLLFLSQLVAEGLLVDAETGQRAQADPLVLPSRSAVRDEG